MRKFTREELEKNDGSDGAAYVAYNGKVYDVSQSYHWKRGIHHATHHAGRDLTGALEKAPHNADMLNRFPIVGELLDSQ